MRRYNNKGGIETISSKMVFELIEKVGDGNHNGFSVYDTTNEDYEKRYRVDCGELGSFEISKFSGEEEYDLKYGDWVWVEGIKYRYHSCSTTYNGYPFLPIEKSYDWLLELTKG